MNDNKFLLIAIHNVGLTKKSFAMKMGVSIQTVNKWINFGYNPSDDNLNKLLDVLQITSEEFYSQKFLDKREENKNEDVKEIVPKDELGYEVRYYSSFMKNYVSEKRMLQDFQKGKANKHVVIVYENGEEKDIAFITGDAIRTKLKFNNCKEVLLNGDSEGSIKKTKEKLEKNKQKKENLLNLKLNGLVDDDIFASKNLVLSQRIDSLEKTLKHLNMEKDEQKNVEKRIKKFRKTLESGEVLESFSREVFESVIDYVIVGGYDDNGVAKPDMLTFVYKAGTKSVMSAGDFKRQRRNAAAYINYNEKPFEGYMEILSFENFGPHWTFVETEDRGRQKIMNYTYDVSVGIAS